MENIKIGFNLIKISTPQFALLEFALDDNLNAFDLSIDIDFGIFEPKKLIASYAKFHFINKVSKVPFIIIEVKCEYQIEILTWESFIDLSNKQITFPLGFLRHLATLTIGTTRGILHAKTENTKFNEFVLPAINLTTIILKDESFKIENDK